MILLWIIGILLAIPTYGISIAVAVILTIFYIKEKLQDIEYNSYAKYDLLKLYEEYCQRVMNGRYPGFEDLISLENLLLYTFKAAIRNQGGLEEEIAKTQIQVALKLTFSIVYMYCTVYSAIDWDRYFINECIRNPNKVFEMAEKYHDMRNF